MQLGVSLYLATSTRPDLAYVVGHVAQFMLDPGPLHWFIVKCIFRYLKHIQSYGLVFHGARFSQTITGWVDSDWGSDPNTRKSISDYAFILASAQLFPNNMGRNPPFPFPLLKLSLLLLPRVPRKLCGFDNFNNFNKT